MTDSKCRVRNCIQRPLLKRLEAWLVFILCRSGIVLFSLAGCRPDAAVRPGDIREYTAPQEVRISAESFTRQQEASGGSGRPRVAYTLPKGWNEKTGASGMRLATLLIGDPADGNEVTIIPAAGSLRSNVERWQKQLGEKVSPDAQAEAVDRALAEAGTVMVEAQRATVVLLVSEEALTPGGTTEAILGGIIPQEDGKTLFVKFRGDATVARRERANFMKFVASLRFP